MSGLGGNPPEPGPIRLLTIPKNKPHSIMDCHCCVFDLGKNSKRSEDWETNSYCVPVWEKSPKRPLQIRIRRTRVYEIDARLRIRRRPCAAQQGNYRCGQPPPVNLNLIVSIERKPLALANLKLMAYSQSRL